MKKKLMLIAAITLAMSAMVGCSNEKEDVKEPEKTVVKENVKDTNKTKEKDTSKEVSKEEQLKSEVIQVVNDNAKFAEEENFEKYMDTLNKAAFNDESKQAVQTLFSDYDIDYTVLETKVLSVSDTEAKVEVTQKAVSKKSESPFQNHIATAVHTLIKEDGKFKFAQTEILNDKTVLLDAEGNTLVEDAE